MIDTRASNATSPNAGVQRLPAATARSNSEWLARALGEEDPAGAILLIGGSNLTHFRLRVAQSQARHDLSPSCWSHAALIRSAAGKRDWNLYEVSLEPRHGFGCVPPNNGVQEGRFSAYDQPGPFPNIACLRASIDPKALAAGETLATVLERAVNRFRQQRNAVDTGALIVEWLAYAWGVGDKTNPLQRNMGIPAAVFLETVFGIAGIELTPGLLSQSSCPEAIWQAAKWWQEFYNSEAALTDRPLEGKFLIRQPAAALVEEEDTPARRTRRRR